LARHVAQQQAEGGDCEGGAPLKYHIRFPPGGYFGAAIKDRKNLPDCLVSY
jgi:hypothetical protein